MVWCCCQGLQSRDVTRLDPVPAAADVKRATALLRDAGTVERRLDVLFSHAAAVNEASYTPPFWDRNGRAGTARRSPE